MFVWIIVGYVLYIAAGVLIGTGMRDVKNHGFKYLQTPLTVEFKGEVYGSSFALPIGNLNLVVGMLLFILGTLSIFFIA